MAYLRPLARDDGGIVRPVNGADVVSRGTAIFNSANAAGVTYSAAALIAGVIVRTLSGAVTDTFDSAVTVIQGLYSNTGGGMEVGETFQVIVSNQGSGIITLSGSAGITVQGTTTIQPATSKILVFTCTAKGVQTYAGGIYTNVGAAFTCMCL